MVAIQSQNGVTNTFQLAATGRQCQREQAGGIAGTEVFYYDGPGDSPSWTSLGATWSRNVVRIGELAAVQESTGTTTFKLADLPWGRRRLGELQPDCNQTPGDDGGS